MTDEEEQEVPKFTTMLEGCWHTSVKTIDELRKPYTRDIDGNPIFLCLSCLREEKGASSKSPYHKLAGADPLPPTRRKPLSTDKKKT